MRFTSISSGLILMFLNLVNVIFAQSPNHAYDPTMAEGVMATSSYTSWGGALGTVNYVNNGNFNFYNYNSSNCGVESYTSKLSLYNSNVFIWSNNCLAFAPSHSPQSGWNPNGTVWYRDATGSYSNYNPPYAPPGGSFYGGFIQTNFMSSSADSIRYRYMIFEFNDPLPVGIDMSFEIEIRSHRFDLDANAISTDQIGFAFLDALPPSPYSNGSFLGNMVTPDFVTPEGNFFENPEIVSYNFVGNGEKYLLVGIFQHPDSLNIIGEMDESFTCKYLMDNVKLYRTNCFNKKVNVSELEQKNCPGTSNTFYASEQMAPYTWVMDGDTLETVTHTLNFIQGIQQHNISVSVDTGFCISSKNMISKPFLFNPQWPLDTVLTCGHPVIFPNQYELTNFTNNNFSFNISSLDGPFQQQQSGNIGITVPQPGAYKYVFTKTTIPTCQFTDTIHVHPAIPLQTDINGNPILGVNIEPEHCINLGDGAIQFVETNYPYPLSYNWEGTLENNSGNLADSLSAGSYSVYVMDSINGCDYLQLEVPLQYDACSAITGNVMFDQNKNCVTDSTDFAFVSQKVIAQPLGNFAYTDSIGNYTILVPSGDYTVVREYPSQSYASICTTNTEVSIPTSGITINSVNFMDTLRLYVHDIEIINIGSPSNLVINGPRTFVASLQNLGDTLASGTLRVHISHNGLTPNIPSGLQYEMDNDTLVFHFNDIAPQGIWTLQFPMFVIQNVNHIGDTCTFDVLVQLNDGADQEHYSFDRIIQGAYDPNDKQAFPSGYTESHYIGQNQDKIQYIIRFQNTGNYPATTVRIADPIHENLIPQSLQLIGYSHYVEVRYYDGELEFLFPQIMLPDSMSNEPESHGFVIFTMDLVPGLSHQSAIDNTAYIYFDANPAIVTNTVAHTIFDCNTFLADFNWSLTDDCSPVLLATSQENWTTNESWYYDNTLVGVGMDLSTPTDNDQWLYHHIENPICGLKADSVFVEVGITHPDISIIDSQVMFNNSDQFDSLIWYINGIPHPEITTTTLELEASATVYLVAWDAQDCERTSNSVDFIFVGIDESNSSDFSIYPNPATNTIFINGLPQDLCDIELFDHKGKRVLTTSTKGKEIMNIQRGELSPGIYLVRICHGGNCGSKKLTIVD